MSGFRLGVLLALDFVPTGADLEHTGDQVDVVDTQCADLSPAQSGVGEYRVGGALLERQHVEEPADSTSADLRPAMTALRRQLKPPGGVHRQQAVADCASAQDPERVKRVSHGRRRQAAAAKVFNERLDVGAMQVGESTCAERRLEVRLAELPVPPDGAGPVEVARPVENPDSVHSVHELVERLADRR